MSVDFYELVLSQARIGAEETVLAVCAGPYDKTTLVNAGIRHAVISNIDYHDGVSEYAPYAWSYQDAENLTLEDESVDWAIVNGGLHHCASPHRAMCEMLRVARIGIVVIESRESLLMRIAVALGLSGDYELE
ncbi:MAG: class I SAM-dependent methyltransferase, partial [Methylocella sp.]